MTLIVTLLFFHWCSQSPLSASIGRLHGVPVHAIVAKASGAFRPVRDRERVGLLQQVEEIALTHYRDFVFWSASSNG